MVDRSHIWVTVAGTVPHPGGETGTCTALVAASGEPKRCVFFARWGIDVVFWGVFGCSAVLVVVIAIVIVFFCCGRTCGCGFWFLFFAFCAFRCFLGLFVVFLTFSLFLLFVVAFCYLFVVAAAFVCVLYFLIVVIASFCFFVVVFCCTCCTRLPTFAIICSPAACPPVYR